MSIFGACAYIMDMAKKEENQGVELYTAENLSDVRNRVSTTMVDMIDRTVQSMNKMSRKLDKIDEALDKAFDVSRMTPNELMAYTAYIRESFKLKQDFLKTLSGYDVNISKVPVQTDNTPIYDEEAAAGLRLEVLRREKEAAG